MSQKWSLLKNISEIDKHIVKLGFKILHITNDYLGSTVYKELYTKLGGENVSQTVYCPIRNTIKEKDTEINGAQHKVVFSLELKKYHRLLFNAKIRFLFNDIRRKVDFSQVDVIHATTWFSDGALAYKLFKAYNIPYIITVRNTDLNLFLKYMLHLRDLAMKILKHADKIIFISPVYLKRFAAHPCIRSYFKELEPKIKIVPNGINDFWIHNKGESKKQIGSPIKLLYIGKFTKNKNVDKLIQAIDELNSEGKKYILNIVGGGGDKRGKISRLVKGKDFINYHGKINNRQTLKALMLQCDIFTMPSKRETFGLVYIEALSQGLPVIFTEHEGIDGFYDGSIGEAVNPYDLESIKNGISHIVSNYGRYVFDIPKISENHNWKAIAKIYLEIYKESIR